MLRPCPRYLSALSFALAALAAGLRAHAQPRPARATPARAAAGTNAVVVRAGDRIAAERARVESGPRFATSIDARARGTLVANVSELLDDAPGVHARSSGDALLPTVVSVRGAPAAQVTVALDGVVLNDATQQAGVDVSLVPPALLERIDVYRGAAPARLGVGGLGGAIELVTRAVPARAGAWLTGGYGSFHQRRASAAVTGAWRSVRTMLALSYRGTQGDFPYYDDRGTELDTRDDRTRTRENNAGDGLDALYRVCAGAQVSPLCVMVLAGWRRHGLPGPGAASLPTPAMEQARVMVRASTRLALARGAQGYLEPYLAAVARRDAFRDYRGVVVPGQPIDARSAGLTLEAGLAGGVHDVSRSVRFEPALRLRHEGFEGRGAIQPTPDATRESALLGGEVTLRRGSIEVLGGIALDALLDQTTAANGASAEAPISRVLLSPRVAVQVRLVRDELLALRASASHLERAPTLQELYGVGGFTVGNPRLRPERSDTVDAGLVSRWRHAPSGVDARLEVAGFARRAADLIVLVRSSVLSLRPMNLRGADVLGAEAQLRLSWRRYLALTASYAYTHAATIAPGDALANGRRPPSIPEHDLYARVEGGAGPVRAWVDLSYVSGIFFDELNSLAAPPRVLMSAAVSVTLPFARWLTVTALGTNLLDQRDATADIFLGTRRIPVRQAISDFAGYPLPARAFFLALSFTTEPTPP